MSELFAPRDDLIRALISADTPQLEGSTIFGNMTMFDTWAEIHSWEGDFLERMGSKAFNKTLRERGDRVKIMFNHGFDPQIGDKPLGKPVVLQARADGVYHETPLSDTSYNKDIAALIEDGAIDGQSIRFSVVADEWVHEPGLSDYNPKGLPERTVIEAKLFEGGPVTSPAYEATTVGIRSRAAFALWRATPPEQRAALLRGDFSKLTTGAVLDTPVARNDDAPVQTTRRVLKHEIDDFLLEVRQVMEGSK